MASVKNIATCMRGVKSEHKQQMRQQEST